MGSSAPPDWMLVRPTEPGFYYGVGTCGKTHTPGRSRELAIERALLEIILQGRGDNPYDIVFEEVEEGGTVSLTLQKEGRTIHTLTGVQVLQEKRLNPSDRGFDQETVVVLIRIPASAMNW
jgi:hypothetical protein